MPQSCHHRSYSRMKRITESRIKCLLIGLIWLSIGMVSAVEVTTGTVVVEKEKNIKDLKKVGVPQYNISFVVEDGKIAVAETKEHKGLFGTKATASAYARIEGLSPETMQAIVDLAYADFVSQLEAAGFEVDKDAYAKIQNQDYVKFHDGPASDHSYYRAFNNKLHDVTVAPTGMNVLKTQTNSLGLPADKFGLTLLNVEYLLHFGYFASETKVEEATAISGAKAEARVTLGQGIQVYWHSGISVINGLENAFKKPNAKVMVEKNFYSTTPFGNTVRDNASGGKEGLSGLFRAAIVGGKRYVITVEENEYTAAALAVIKKVNEALVKELAANR